MGSPPDQVRRLPSWLAQRSGRSRLTTMAASLAVATLLLGSVALVDAAIAHQEGSPTSSAIQEEQQLDPEKKQLDEARRRIELAERLVMRQRGAKQLHQEQLDRMLAGLEASLHERTGVANERLARTRELLERAVEGQRAGGVAHREALHSAQQAMESAVIARRHALEGLRSGLQDRRFSVRSAPRVRISAPGMLLRRGSNSADAILARAEELELTDDQQDGIRSAERDHRRAEIERQAAIEVAELDLDSLLENEYEADLGAVQTQMEQISRMRVEDRVAGLRLRQQIRAILTPGQRDKADEMRRHPFGVLTRTLREGDPHQHEEGEEHEGPSVFFFDGDEGSIGFGDHANELFEFRRDWTGDGAEGAVWDFKLDDLDLHGFEFEFGDLPFGIWSDHDHDHDDADNEDGEEGEQGEEEQVSSGGRTEARPEIAKTL